VVDGDECGVEETAEVNRYGKGEGRAEAQALKGRIGEGMAHQTSLFVSEEGEQASREEMEQGSQYQGRVTLYWINSFSLPSRAHLRAGF
jgi:hypothetical protein